MSDDSTGGAEAEADGPAALVDDAGLPLELADPDLSLDSLAEGRALKAQFVSDFGSWFDTQVRPLLRRVHLAGGEPQLLVNDIAALMMNIADSIYVSIDGDDSDDD